MGQNSQNYKNSINEVDQIYSQWVEKSKSGKNFISITISINGKETEYKGIGVLNAKAHAYIYGFAEIAKIKNLTEQSASDKSKLELAKAELFFRSLERVMDEIFPGLENVESF